MCYAFSIETDFQLIFKSIKGMIIYYENLKFLINNQLKIYICIKSGFLTTVNDLLYIFEMTFGLLYLVLACKKLQQITTK